jgi:hypothetical protein
MLNFGLYDTISRPSHRFSSIIISYKLPKSDPPGSFRLQPLELRPLRKENRKGASSSAGKLAE